MENLYGNLQKIKGGKRSFTITPYIPGGFVSPDTLEKITSVARKYNAALKITTGQRIMIMNLEEKDLSAIWEELGMKPGVVTHNSVKNVVICPSGFCKRSRYNTIGLGMKISKKFHGKDMPGRTKIGVSGCRNACGSVYSKDVGIIGDGEGLMVVAGGSSGFVPRQADIIATKLSEDQAFSLLENILGFYKENALPGEKLSRFIDRIGIDSFRLGVLAGGV